MAAVALPPPPARRRLSRAGWNVLSSSSLPGRPETHASRPSSRSSTRPSTPGEFEAEGMRLVTAVASSWSQQYIFMIRKGGAKDGLLHYECLFSRPTDEQPVPVAVASVCFAFLAPQMGRAPRLFYSFEEGDLRHEWTLLQDASGRWHTSSGQQFGSLREQSFEAYLDSCIRDKERARRRGINIRTKYEVSRLKPPPAFETESQKGSRFSSKSSDSDFGMSSSRSEPYTATASTLHADKREMAQAMQDALKAANMYCEKVTPPNTLRELLVNMFDAADEEGLGEMPHYEVARVLMATLPGFGLEDWDIHQLLSHAEETDEGCINYGRFVKDAPQRVKDLRMRRMEFKDRGFPGVEIPLESVKHCFSDELTATYEKLLAVLVDIANEDPDHAIFAEQSTGRPGLDGDDRALVALKRRRVHASLQHLSERISPQEGKMIFQMLPEDEHGFLYVSDLANHLETIRVGALLNSVTESNGSSLRRHLVQCFRPLLDESGMAKIWMLKQGFLNADQLCLSQLQIHTILCLAEPDQNGDVDVNIFLALCNSVIPHMMNAGIFVQTAERLQLEAAEAAKERQNAEWAMGNARITSDSDDEDEDKEKEKVAHMDQDGVERTLIQVFSLSDDTRKPTPALPPATIFQLLCHAGDQQVQSCALDALEVSGLLAEMSLDAQGEVAFHDFVRRWVPVLFELRGNQLLNAYMKPGAAEYLGLPEPNLDELEKVCALMPEQEGVDQETPMIRTESSIVRRRGSTGSRQVTYQSSIGSRGGGGMNRQSSISSVVSAAVQPMSSEPAKKIPSKQEVPPGRGYSRRKLWLEERAQVRPETK